MADAYLGEIRAFAGLYAPQGWALCNGALMSISNYQALYSLIGTIYGGDGATTFALPDLRGRIAMGQGTGPGLTPRTIGDKTGGAETVVLAESNNPQHTHTVTVSTAGPSIQTPNTSTYLGPVDSTIGTGEGYLPGTIQGVTINHIPLGQSVIGTAGNSISHNNMMPYGVVTYIICLNGLYPTPQ